MSRLTTSLVKGWLKQTQGLQERPLERPRARLESCMECGGDAYSSVVINLCFDLVEARDTLARASLIRKERSGTVKGVKMSERKVLIGKVPVDSGQIVLLDPRHLELWDGSEDYDGVVEATSNANGGDGFVCKKWGGAPGHPMGVACRTGGDGFFPVYAVFGDDKKPNLITGIEVQFGVLHA